MDVSSQYKKNIIVLVHKNDKQIVQNQLIFFYKKRKAKKSAKIFDKIVDATMHEFTHL